MPGVAIDSQPTMPAVPDDGPLADAAAAFVDAVATALQDLAHRDDLRDTVELEAANLAAAVIDADGRRTDAEKAAYATAFGQILDASPVRADWARTPSTLFRLLVDADHRDGTRRSHIYYEHAVTLAHATASVDLLPSARELTLIDEHRMTMLHALDAAGVARPGTVAPAVAPQAKPTARPLEELLAELDGLIGLAAVKQQVRLLTNLLRVQKMRTERKLPVIEVSHHLVFTGNPGTGKTTVARLLAQIYRALGAVSKGQLVETDRSHMVAGYVGQTAILTRGIVEQALGGLLLIDEAYALARGGEHDFGKEAIDTLVKLMEDHRDDLAVIAAGYTDEMETFIESNPGLRSRFARTIEFPDYTDDELVQIFCAMGAKDRYQPTAGAIEALRARLTSQRRDRGFGNARFVRNVFEQAVTSQATRIVGLTDPSDDVLTTLEATDIPSTDA
jgi:SpoVK/Ycf46/Vps4 family AAA+-type ATPase